jgi:hypothetical protein
MPPTGILRRCSPFVAMALLGLLLAGCSTFFTGGGWLPSLVPGQKATMGVEFRCNADSTGGQTCATGRAHGTYNDHGAGVQFTFAGILGAGGPALGTNSCFSGTIGYTSPRGSGTVLIVACDNGQPGTGHDALTVWVQSGPYRDYLNSGILQGGNFIAH